MTEPIEPDRAVLSGAGEWSPKLPSDLAGKLVSLELTTPPPITRHVARMKDGGFLLIFWDSQKALYQWSEVTYDYAMELLETVRRYRNLSSWQELFDARPAPTAEDELQSDLVTLLQAAAICNRSKRTIERLAKKRGFPRPRVRGGGGKPNEYAWPEMRIFLEHEYKRPLPETFPASRFRRVE